MQQISVGHDPVVAVGNIVWTPDPCTLLCGYAGWRNQSDPKRIPSIMNDKPWLT